ncbi:hypothetical protein BH11MYX3_BH11MYX3_21250 [soil metagenome]
MKDDDLDPSFAMHDELLARRGVEVWVGAEPTFTRADSLEAAWISSASGDDKLQRAHVLATAVANAHPGASVSRVIGRQYPDEPAPRFAFGVRWRDDVGHGGARVALDATPVPPPTEVGDDHWLSVTPDPGVVEVNMAPAANALAFTAQAAACGPPRGAPGSRRCAIASTATSSIPVAAVRSRSAAHAPMRARSCAIRTCCPR